MRKIILKETCVNEMKIYLGEILSLLINKKYDDLYNEEIVTLFSQIAFEILEKPNNVVSGREQLEYFMKKYVDVNYDLLFSLTERKGRISDFKINMYQNYLELAIGSLANITDKGELLSFPFVENKTVYLCNYNPYTDYYDYTKIAAGIFKENI